MSTVLKHGYSMLTCAAPHPCCSGTSGPNLFFSLLALFLHSTAASFPHTVSNTNAGQVGRKGVIPAKILMVDEIASCRACIERSVTNCHSSVLAPVSERNAAKRWLAQGNGVKAGHMYIYLLNFHPTHSG